MRIFIALLLPCALVLGADPSIHVVTTVRTNESGSVTTKDVFTRGGQTNLVRTTSTKSGTVRIRVHRFYYRGSIVADFVAMPDSSGFTTEAGSPYSISFEFDVSYIPKSAVIGTKEGFIVDAFSFTNGVFSPLESSVITKANTVGSEVRGAMDQLRDKSKSK